MTLSRTATLSEVGEFPLIAAVTDGLVQGSDVIVGPGDDAAVLAVDGAVAASIDVLVEGVHFRRDWSGGADVGRKVVAVNVADLEAVGARPTGIVIGFSAPGHLPLGWVQDFTAGMRSEAERAGVSVLGGDITKARDITIAVTALGVLDGRTAVLRSGARPGDVVAFVGRLGWAAAGLVVLGRGFRSPRAVVEAQRVPEVPYGEGARAAAAGATSMIDVSDGLLADLGHIAEASAVGIDLTRAAFSVPDPLQAVAAATGADPYELILTGGEDHALAATFPAGRPLPSGWQQIGVVTDSRDGDVRVDGEVWDAPRGWDHFAAARGRR